MPIRKIWQEMKVIINLMKAKSLIPIINKKCKYCEDIVYCDESKYINENKNN